MRETARHLARLRGAVDDTRTRLLGEARDLFLSSGPGSFSLREVARRSGVSAAAVYRHFDGKEALLGAACKQGFDLFSTYLVRGLGAVTPRARLVATAEQYRLFALENPQDYRFIFMSADRDPIAQAKSAPAAGDPAPRHATFQFLVDRVCECQASGELGRDPATKTALFLWAHLHGLVALRLAGHVAALDDAGFAALYRESLGWFLRGLAA